MTIDSSPRAPGLEHQIRQNLNEGEVRAIQSKVKELLRWVPYRFLRPLFSAELKGIKETNVNKEIIKLCDENFDIDRRRVMYKFDKGAIILNENWATYLNTHQQVLRGFTYLHLIKFLQRNNPNVPGLPSKIFKPAASDRNLSDARRFWREFLLNTSNYQCIYSGQVVSPVEFSLDHFLPWSFVVHNHYWNLIPVPSRVNSSKSDWLPDWKYFPKFARQQFEIFKFYFQNGDRRALEDYFMNIVPNEYLVTQDEFIQHLEHQILPQYQIAKNMGFLSPFTFKDN